MKVILIVGFSFVILFIIVNYLYDNFYKGEINQYYTNLTPTKVWLIIILIINLFIFIFIISYSEYLIEIISSGKGFKGRRGIKGETGSVGLIGEPDSCKQDCNDTCDNTDDDIDGNNIFDDIDKSTRIYDERKKYDKISIDTT